MLTDDENAKILQEEMESIRTEILQLYNSSGKRITGEFESGLQIEYNGITAVLKGYTYLGGRRPGKMPPLDAIEKWIEASASLTNFNNIKIDYDILAQKIGEQVGRANASLPPAQIEISTITEAQADVTRRQVSASF